MEKELAAYPDKPRISEPFSFAKLNLRAGREQLAAIPDLIRGEKVFTNPVAARAVLESATLALWLLDTEIDEKERVTRGIIQLCDGKNQLRKFYNEDGNDAAVAQINDFFENRLPLLLASNGIIFQNNAGNPVPPQDKKPNIVDMIRQVLGNDFRLAYRILSGFAHGQPNILLTFAYDFDNAAGAGGMKMVNYKPKDQIQLYSFRIAGKAFEKALETYFAISNWDFNKIKPVFNNFFTEIDEASKNSKN